MQINEHVRAMRVLADAFDTAAVTCLTKESAALRIAAMLADAGFEIVPAPRHMSRRFPLGDGHAAEAIVPPAVHTPEGDW